MTRQDRAAKLKALTNLKTHIEKTCERHRFPPAVADRLDDAWEAVGLAIEELGVDWDRKLEDWEQGEPKGKEER